MTWCTLNTHCYRPRTEYDGRLCFDTCLSIHPSIHPTFCLSTPRGGTRPGPGGGGTLLGGYPARGIPCWGYLGRVPPRPGPDRGVPWPGPDGGVPWQGTPPARSRWGVPWQGTPPQQGTPPPRSWWRGTLVGQQKEYLLHGGRYASCIHAGGLSCLIFRLEIDGENNIMYINSMTRACSVMILTGCTDDANFVTIYDYCSTHLCNNVVSPCFNYNIWIFIYL